MLVKSNLFPRQLWTCCAWVHGWLLARAKDLVLRALSAVRENQILNNLAFKTIWAKLSLSLSDQAKQISIWCKGTSALKGQKRWWGLEHTPRKQIYPNWMWRNKSIQTPLTLQGMPAGKPLPWLPTSHPSLSFHTALWNPGKSFSFMYLFVNSLMPF